MERPSLKQHTQCISAVLGLLGETTARQELEHLLHSWEAQPGAVVGSEASLLVFTLAVCEDDVLDIS